MSTSVVPNVARGVLDDFLVELFKSASCCYGKTPRLKKTTGEGKGLFGLPFQVTVLHRGKSVGTQA